MNDYKYKNSILFLFLIFFVSLLMAICYAAINGTTLNIGGNISASPIGDIYISNIQFISDKNGEHENCSMTYEGLAINCIIELASGNIEENVDSYVEYEIEISNSTNDNYSIENIISNSNFYSNEDIVCEIEGLDENNEVPAHSIETFKIKFKYREGLAVINNNTLEATISYDLDKTFSVTYNNVTGNFPDKAYEGKDLIVNIGSGYDYMDITIGESTYSDYIYSGGILTIHGADLTGNIVIEPIHDTGTVTATFLQTNIDLTDKTSEVVTLQINNTYHSAINILSFVSSNNLFEVLDANGEALTSYKIEGESTQSYGIAIKKKYSEYTSSPENLFLTLTCNNGTVLSTNTLTLTIPFVVVDSIPPTIEELSVTMIASSGNLTVNWIGIDNSGGNIIYTIILYNESNTQVGNPYTTNQNATSYTINGVAPGHKYYVKIYGEDELGNNGASYLNQATTTSEYCKKSNETGRFSITTNFNEISSSNTAQYVALGESYTTTLSYSGNALLGGNVTANSVEVTMGGSTIVSSGRSNNTNIATYTNNRLTINSVTGNLTIKANGQGNGCLAEGTQITLANGIKKSIEDIGYDDLLLVWNYENGTFTYEYPIWIEKEHKATAYQLTTFSDGTTLKTVGYHGVFSLDSNSFVSVDDADNFKIGTNISKINENKNGFSKVRVEKIEYIEDSVCYYHVVSTRYYNIIANDLLTTDGTTILSNLYGFNENIIWSRAKELKNLYDYSEFNDVMPYYMFKGLRAEEGKVLEEILPKELFREYLLKNQLNKEMLLEPIKNLNGDNLWMVTTSDDEITETNKYLLEEGAYYTLPEPKVKDNFIGWYNTSDNLMYNSGSTLQIWMGTHFIAKILLNFPYIIQATSYLGATTVAPTFLYTIYITTYKK